MKKMRPMMAVMAFALSYSVSMAASADLSYYPEAGSQWEMKSVIKAKIPKLGNTTYTVNYSFSCMTSSESESELEVSVETKKLNGSPAPTVDASLTLSSEGTVSNLQLNGPGGLVRNVGLIFPRLPGGSVAIGESWTARVVFYLPPAKGFPASVRLDGVFKYVGEKDGKEQISITLKGEAKKIRVELAGKCFFDADTGYVTSSALSGVIKVKKFIWLKIPVTIDSY